jgi:hypothetical protein
MVIFGSRAVHLKSVELKTTNCPSCNTQESLVLSIFRKHAHVFWIPMFPIGKKGVTQCQHCKNVLETKEMPEPIKRQYINLKNETKGPIWQFAGVGIITALIVWAIYANGENKKLEIKYIASPVVGDVYEYEIESGSYSTLKVMNISKDSVFVFSNNYEIDRKSKVDKIDKPENYSDLFYGISKSKIKKMYDDGDIFEVNR